MKFLILDFHVFSLSEAHLSADDEAEAQIEGYTYIGLERLLVGAKAEVSGFTFLHLPFPHSYFYLLRPKHPWLVRESQGPNKKL